MYANRESKSKLFLSLAKDGSTWVTTDFSSIEMTLSEIDWKPVGRQSALLMFLTHK